MTDPTPKAAQPQQPSLKMPIKIGFMAVFGIYLFQLVKARIDIDSFLLMVAIQTLCLIVGAGIIESFVRTISFLTFRIRGKK